MDTVDLKEYLGIVVDMEKNIYLQNSLLTSLKAKIERLEAPIHIQDPPKPSPPTPKETKAKVSLFPSILLFLACMLVRAFAVSDGHSEWLVHLCEIAAPLSFIGALLHNISKVDSINKEIENDFQQKNYQYQLDHDKYINELKSNKTKHQTDTENRKRQILLCESEIQQITKNLAGTKEKLNFVYSKNVIFPKYRNLIMVCSLYEYVCAGRCTALEGYEGAYNILEMEIRLDRIITQLDKVIAQLGAIQSNQFMLYSAIQESNRQSAQILESTQHMADSLQSLGGQAEDLNVRIAELQKTSALTAYQAKRAQKELHYMNRMNYLSGKYDDVFFNLPPT